MIQAILGIVGSALSIWDSKEKTKYEDKYMKLKRDWYEEYNKADNDRDDAVLDDIEFNIELLAVAISSKIRAEKS